jgi:hypothetical protein
LHECAASPAGGVFLIASHEFSASALKEDPFSVSIISQTGRTNGHGLIYPISEKAFRQFITLLFLFF